MRWLLLGLAILFEVVGTASMKASYGMTRLAPTVVMAISYLFCFMFLSLSLKRIDVGIAYAIWSGIGTAAIATIGIVYFKEPLSAMKLASLGLIILGVVGLNLSGATR